MKKYYYLFLFSIFLLPDLAADLGQSAKVKRVVDGDTLHLADGRKIRLVGVDTPEVHESQKLDKDAARSHQDKKTIQELGKRSSNFVKKLVQSEKVELEFEPGNKTDKYGRTLAYVWFDCTKAPAEYLQYLKAKGETWHPGKLMLNRLLIQCGYANAYTRFPFQYLDEFRECERTARQNEIGLWGPVEGLQQTEEPKTKKNSPTVQITPGTAFLASKNGKVYHPANCHRVSSINPANLISFQTEEEAIASGRRKCQD